MLYFKFFLKRGFLSENKEKRQPSCPDARGLNENPVISLVALCFASVESTWLVIFGLTATVVQDLLSNICSNFSRWRCSVFPKARVQEQRLRKCFESSFLDQCCFLLHPHVWFRCSGIWLEPRKHCSWRVRTSGNSKYSIDGAGKLPLKVLSSRKQSLRLFINCTGGGISSGISLWN